MSRQGYRQLINCSDIFPPPFQCCFDCNDSARKIYMAPPHKDGVNYDYLIPFDIYSCCKHYHSVKNLSRDWWLNKMVDLGLHMIVVHPQGGIDYAEMTRLYAPKPYVAEKIPDDVFQRILNGATK